MNDCADESSLDHAGFVVSDPEEHRQFFESLMRAEFLPGPQDAAGFNACQWRFRNEMKIEFLQPARPDQSSFAAEFLARHGPGIHHLTFRVPDLQRAIAKSEGFGVPILYQNTDHPTWLEAFVHPKHGFGTVLQFAEFPEYRPAPRERTGAVAAFTSITLAASDQDRAAAYFTQVLGGRAATSSPTTLVWPGPVALELVPAAEPPGEGVRQVTFESRAEKFANVSGTRSDVAFAPGLPFSFLHAPA